MKRILSILLVLTMVAGCASALAEGTFRVGMECNYAPFNWTQAEASDTAVAISGGGGYADGYDVQIAKKIAEGLGKELVIVKTEWDGLAMGVTSGLFDAIIAGMSPTEQRKATLDFSDPYYTSELVIVVKKDGPYAAATKLSDFTGATITAQLNTFHDTVVDQIPDVKHATAMETFPAMIVALQSGAVDGYIAERPGAIADTTANPDLTYVQFAEGQGFTASESDVSVAVGLAKGSELLAPINEILAGIDTDTRNQMMSDATARQPLVAQ
jgi:putative lysine transport system substrate-binding protein